MIFLRVKREITLREGRAQNALAPLFIYLVVRQCIDFSVNFLIL